MTRTLVASFASAVILVTLYHAYLEWIDDALADWLGEDLRFVAPHWLANVLWLAAVGAVLLPLAAALAFDVRAWWIVAGALIGDALLTHILPTVLSPSFFGPVPATDTWPLQAIAAVACVVAAWSHGRASWLLLVGVAEFVPLRFTLRRLMGLGILKSRDFITNGEVS